MTPLHYVIVGNGPAANQAAVTLRSRAPGTRVTIIGREPRGYYRPHLLPDFIAGNLAGAERTTDTAAESIFDYEGMTLNTSWWTEL